MALLCERCGLHVEGLPCTRCGWAGEEVPRPFKVSHRSPGRFALVLLCVIAGSLLTAARVVTLPNGIVPFAVIGPPWLLIEALSFAPGLALVALGFWLLRRPGRASRPRA